MNIQHLLYSTCGTLFTLSCLVAQGGLAQSSLQISNGGTVIQSRSSSVVLTNTPLYPSNPLGNSVFRSWQMPLPQGAIPKSAIPEGSFSTQRTSISLNSATLKQPHQLTILTPNTLINGQVKVNGRVIRSFKGGRTSFNLAPYLSRGTKTVEITGTYPPTNAPVRIEFSGPGTHLSQQTSGNGKFTHTFVITGY